MREVTPVRLRFIHINRNNDNDLCVGKMIYFHQYILQTTSHYKLLNKLFSYEFL